MAHQVAIDCHVQNDYQLYITLTNSVDEDTKGKIQREKNEFMTGAAGDVPSSMLYFNKLMMKDKVNSRPLLPTSETTSGCLTCTCRQQQSATFIAHFNDYVHNQMAALSTCGETTHKLLNNLFKACARADCEEFHDFIKDAQRDWECKHHVYKPEILMNKCQDKYSCLLLLSQCMYQAGGTHHYTPYRKEILRYPSE
jgi:hypothetical protein